MQEKQTKIEQKKEIEPKKEEINLLYASPTENPLEKKQ